MNLSRPFQLLFGINFDIDQTDSSIMTMKQPVSTFARIMTAKAESTGVRLGLLQIESETLNKANLR